MSIQPHKAYPGINRNSPVGDLSTKSTMRAALRQRRQAFVRDAAPAPIPVERLEDVLSAMRTHFAQDTLPYTWAGYFPTQEEADPSALLQELRARGYRTVYPCIQSKTLPLLFRAWAENDPITQGAYGIYEPLPDAKPCFPDVILTPVVAFDRRGLRLGMGGGFYDRTFEVLAPLKPLKIGVALDIQCVEQVPALSHDYPLDLVITESTVYHFSHT